MLEWVQTAQTHQPPILPILFVHPTSTAVVGANAHVVELAVVSLLHVASAIRLGELAATLLHVASAIKLEFVVALLRVASAIRVQVRHLLDVFDGVALSDAYAYQPVSYLA